MTKRILSRLIATTSAGLVCVASASAQQQSSGDLLTRVELLALIQTLNASLLASRSATTTLEKWCADHKMSAEPKIVAKRLTGQDKEPSAQTRERLGVGASEPVAHRRVQLSCGGHVFSEADNWYVPSRLSEEMNRRLETTDAPFGKVVAPLQPFRRTIDMTMRWSPLPEGWELAAHPSREGRAAPLPNEIFSHTAIVYGQDQKPISEVHETYTRGILDFSPHSREPAKD